MATRTKIIGKKISEMSDADFVNNELSNYKVPLANTAGGDERSYTNEKAGLDKIKDAVKDDDKVKVKNTSEAKYLSEAINNPNLDYDLGDDTITMKYPDIRVKSKTLKVNGEIPEDLENHYKDITKTTDDVTNPTKNIYDLGLEVVSEAATWLNYNDNIITNGVASLTRNAESALTYSRQNNEYSGDIDENCGLPNGVYMVYADIGFWFNDVTDELNEVSIRPYVNNSLVTGKEVKFFVDHTQEAGYINHKECVFLVKVTDSSEDNRRRINLKAMIDGANAKAKIFHIQIVAIEQSYITYIESESTQYELQYIHYAHEGKAVSFTNANNSGVVTYVGASNPNVDGSHDLNPISGNGDLTISREKKYCGLCTLKIESLNPSVNTYQFEASIESAANKTIVVPFTVDASETSESSITFDWVAVGIDTTSITIRATESIATGDEIRITPTDYSVFEFGVGKRSGNDHGIEQISRDNTLVGDGIGTPLGVDTVDEEDRVKHFMQPLLDEKQDVLTPGANINIDPNTNEISAVDTTYSAGEGTGLSIDSEHDNKISVNAGNGIGIDSNNNVYVKKGNGLEFSGDVLVVKQGSGITIDGSGVSVNTGKGIEVDGTSNQVKARLGNGLEFDSDQDTAGIKVKASNGIEVDGNGVKAKGNTAEGIEVTANGIALKDGDGITFDANGNATINHGNGLDIDGHQLVVKKGDGLDFDNGALVVKGKTKGGIKVTSNGVELQVKSGGNVKIDNNGDVDVPAEANGGIVAGANGLKLATPGNGINQDAQSGALSVKANTSAGVDVDSSGVKVKADATKGVNVDATNGIQVKLAQTDAGLAFDENGGLKSTTQGKIYQAGDGIDITGNDSDTINVKLANEGGLQFDENGGLKIKPEEIETVVTEEVETAVETLQSRIMYTVSPATINNVSTVGSPFKNGQQGIYGVIFSPSMDLEIIDQSENVDGTSILFFYYNGRNSGTTSEFYLAIYELDLTSKKAIWICNTDDLSDQMNNQTLVVGKVKKSIKNQDGSNYFIHSNKLYYIVLFRNTTSGSEGDINVAGVTAVQSTVNSGNSGYAGAEIFINSSPRVAFAEGNYGSSYVDWEDFSSVVPSITVDGTANESPMHMFAAVTNAKIGSSHEDLKTITVVEPFSGLLVLSSYEFVVARNYGMLMQEFTPEENISVSTITLYDTISDDDYQEHFYRGNILFKKTGENSFTKISESLNGYKYDSTHEAIDNKIFCKHVYEYNVPIELEAGETYLIPIISSYKEASSASNMNVALVPLYKGTNIDKVTMYSSADAGSNETTEIGEGDTYFRTVNNLNPVYVLINGNPIYGALS